MTVHECAGVLMLCGSQDPGSDAIVTYAQGLAEALRRAGTPSDVRVIRTDAPDRRRALGEALAAARGGTGVVLHYNPFSWGRRGFAPYLPGALWRARLPRVVLMAHECHVDPTSARFRAMRSWQRPQLRGIARNCDAHLVSTDAWLPHLARYRPSRMAISSVLPDCRAERAAVRGELGAGATTLVVTAFGTDHPSRLRGHIAAAANAVAARAREPIVLQNLGAAPPALSGLDASIRFLSPGYLEARELARRLAASDVFLCPFIDGASTRRTTLMAAMQHGLAIVTTQGPRTDDDLRDPAALVLCDPGDPAGFAAAAARLADDPRERTALGAAARRSYEERFDWPVAVACLRTALGGDRRSASRS